MVHELSSENGWTDPQTESYCYMPPTSFRGGHNMRQWIKGWSRHVYRERERKKTKPHTHIKRFILR